RLVLCWTEVNGPAVMPPTHQGFGTTKAVWFRARSPMNRSHWSNRRYAKSYDQSDLRSHCGRRNDGPLASARHFRPFARATLRWVARAQVSLLTISMFLFATTVGGPVAFAQVVGGNGQTGTNGTGDSGANGSGGADGTTTLSVSALPNPNSAPITGGA